MTEITATQGAPARAESPAFPTEREAFRVWLRIALLSFRRACWTDRGDAPDSGGRKTLDFREPFPACAELLHVAPRPRGATARHLCRLADAQNARRHHRRRSLYSARRDLDHGAKRHLRRFRPGRRRRGTVLRFESRRARHRHPGGDACRQTRAEKPGLAGAGSRSVHRHFLFQSAVPADHSSGRRDRICGHAARCLRFRI